ncbi:MAG: Methyltransferase type 11 [Parcubacteria group bacterium GW2011_GWC2_38_7]|nr:MAG: Methyltransferase type 11 [Parcubacteria group bacterium GW2011_GWC2_38_7]
MRMDVEGIERSTIDSLVKLDGKNILEVGCGTGRETGFLTRTGNSVLAIDPDAGRIAEAKVCLPGVDFRCLDFLKLDWKRLFDLVVFTMSLHHIPTRDAKLSALAKARQALKNNGEVLVIEPSLDGELTRVICEFVPEELSGITEAREILLGPDSRYVAAALGVEAIWEFDDERELISFFVTLLSKNRSDVTYEAVAEVLSRLGLAGRTRMNDIIDFYVL